MVFSYSFPSTQGSSARVTLWRRLSRLGAISPKSGVHILPGREDCLESFQWLAREVQQQKGECLLMNVESFEGLSDQELMKLFKDKSVKEYLELEESLKQLEKATRGKVPDEERTKLHSEVEKHRRKHAEIARCDFFDAPGGARLTARLASIERALAVEKEAIPEIRKVRIKDFKNKVWVTRPRPHVDRLACAWLIRRFIDESATIRYSKTFKEDELAFDMKEGGAFGHVGNFCTFETMLVAFDWDSSALRTISEIIHEIDLRDSRYLHPETAGIDAILSGWLLNDFSDADLEAHGLALFDGVYADVLRKEKLEQQGKKR
ncbi:MAG: chromate resistance protein [Candidatus Melainabacteria bacterium]|nr:chromate resistance protein [Candidatus Melainabacteria bacterium]